MLGGYTMPVGVSAQQSQHCCDFLQAPLLRNTLHRYETNIQQLLVSVAAPVGQQERGVLRVSPMGRSSPPPQKTDGGQGSIACLTSQEGHDGIREI